MSQNDMLLLTVAVTLVVVYVDAASIPPGGYYTTRYDHVDVDNILNQKRLVQNYAKCFFNRGPCAPQGVEFKRILPEAIQTNCLRCTEKQRYIIQKTLRRLKKEHPQVYEEIVENWDPDKTYIPVLMADSPIGENDVTNVELDNRFFGPSEQPNVIVSVERIPEYVPAQPVAPIVPQTFPAPPPSSTRPPSPPPRPSTTRLPPPPPSTFRIPLPVLIPSSTQQPRPQQLVPLNTLPPLQSPITASTKSINSNQIPQGELSFTVTQGPNPFIRNPNTQLTASVSLNAPPILTEPIKALSSIGTQVVEAGGRLADVLVSTVQGLLGGEST